MFQLDQQNIVSAATAGFFALLLLLLLRPIAVQFELVDRPSERKRHGTEIPLIGGLCVYVASFVSWVIFTPLTDTLLYSLMFCGFLFLSLGVADDLFDIGAGVKLAIQFIFALAFILSSDIYITNLGNLFGLVNPLALGPLSLPLTLLAIVGLTNAFNMIDGCDGLAGSLALLSVTAMLCIGAGTFNVQSQFYLASLAVSLAVFLIFNFSNAKYKKVFLGDGGSLFIGFVVAVSLIQFSERSENYSPSVVLWIVSIPIFDFCTVIACRLLHGKKIMFADRSHIHHLLLSLGLTHLKVTSILVGLAFFLLIFGIFVEHYYSTLSLPSFLVLFLLYFCVRLRTSKRI